MMKMAMTALCAALMAGCSMMQGAMNSAMSSTSNTAGNVVGQRVGGAIGDQMMAGYQPQMMGAYTGYLFTLAFSSGGIAVQQGDYDVGDYTRWSLPSNDGTVNTIERARLPDDDKGNQWWKVKFVNGKKNETTILEGLFNPERTKLLRLRGQFPKEEAKEIAVTEQTYYVAPTRLTAESIEGATKGSEDVTVPAGTFNARHVVYQYGSGTQEWWLADGVPGGLVKQSVQGKEQSGKGHEYTMTLAAYGKDAKDELSAIKTASN
jgi:hypothetical protein